MSVTPPLQPDEVPVRPAATIMLLADQPDLHVLLLRRRAASAFVGGMTVFPGGGVDAADADADDECLGLTDAAASARIGVAAGGLAYWVAAIRETFEEAGVLLAVNASGGDPDLADPSNAERFALLRRDVDEERMGIREAARKEGLALAADRIHYVARWITPKGPPRRYDTRFFVAALPAGQQALHDDREAVHSEWLRPAEAIRRYEAGERDMLPPTYAMLRILSRFDRSSDAMAAAALHEDGPDVPARLQGGREGWRVLLPGDPDYEGGANHEMKAWVRLWPEPEGSM